ncbi:MAG: hypothetical protein A2015_12315 [Spirochaetes bacterium GWF1_31_7]|nr:MAG: hypothetical protein A2Y30_09260 [Spirochaetes bacterium GWE1_32_154]OHD49014.1 MAG: hypothetical protein A2Y29_17230 [Spirochaetes bacterium GWE2_31_10]OHD49546.1 MAG: hypothetical protein A2015_12315 [Spirochaetes bacterium GWF1_31_7]OHD82731.1 MAG: hypothetical protein A2355_02955 [Spirochaetes bacterium RIFOXYB1_FULL_32_8]HBD95889.1 dTDP-glucose 4,6-dehydratase [Spirochaetia bacterium]
MKEKIFITGGLGFIGSHIAELYSTKGFEVVLYDNLKSGTFENIQNISNYTFIEGDINDRDLLTNAMKGCTTVYHFAAEISVPESMKQPIETELVNTIGTINVLESMIANTIKTIVFASSAAVYGMSEICPKLTTFYPEPTSPYAISKLSSEYYVKSYCDRFGMKGIIPRFFNVFGERQRLGSGYAAAIPIFISKALKNEPITIYGDGEQTRDFIYVKDLALYLFYLSTNFPSGVYNIGYGTFITINDIAKIIIRLSNSKSQITHVAPRIGDIKYSYASIGELSDLPINLTGFDKGLRNTIDFFRT